MIKYIIVGFTSNINLDKMQCEIDVLGKDNNWTTKKEDYKLFDTRRDAIYYIRLLHCALAVPYGIEIVED